MSRITICEEKNRVEVWIGLEDDTPPDGISFIIGLGRTHEEAIAQAVADLEAALATLRAHELPESRP